MKNATRVDGSKLYPKYEGNEKMVSIHYDSRAVREANKLGARIYKLSGAWTGYGYETLDRYVTAGDAAKIRKALQAIDQRSAGKKSSQPLTPPEKIDRWSRRLDRLTACGAEVAAEIAREKIDYAFEHLETAMNAPINGWRIPAWQRVARRKYTKAIDDPAILLQKIEDSEHADAILAASRRHNNSDYEHQLEAARDLRDVGQIDRDEVREYARSAAQYNRGADL